LDEKVSPVSESFAVISFDPAEMVKS